MNAKILEFKSKDGRVRIIGGSVRDIKKNFDLPGFVEQAEEMGEVEYFGEKFLTIYCEPNYVKVTGQLSFEWVKSAVEQIKSKYE